MSNSDRCIFSRHPHSGDDMDVCGAIATWRVDYLDLVDQQMWVEYHCERHVFRAFLILTDIGSCSHSLRWLEPHATHRIEFMGMRRFQSEIAVELLP